VSAVDRLREILRSLDEQAEDAVLACARAIQVKDGSAAGAVEAPRQPDLVAADRGERVLTDQVADPPYSSGNEVLVPRRGLLMFFGSILADARYGRLTDEEIAERIDVWVEEHDRAPEVFRHDVLGRHP
jgi:hypothetical protein